MIIIGGKLAVFLRTFINCLLNSELTWWLARCCIAFLQICQVHNRWCVSINTISIALSSFVKIVFDYLIPVDSRTDSNKRTKDFIFSPNNKAQPNNMFLLWCLTLTNRAQIKLHLLVQSVISKQTTPLT